MPWLLAGVMFFSLMGVLVYPILFRDDVAPEPPPGAAMGTASGGGPFGNAAAVDLSSMTPREQADRLWNRVMMAASGGDSTQVSFFVPMAIQAYQALPEFDTDALFHLSMLQQTADDLPAAIETAEEGLTRNESHLLLLYALAEAQYESGDEAAARVTYGRLLDAWDAEQATSNFDYEAHRDMFPQIEARARQIAGR